MNTVHLAGVDLNLMLALHAMLLDKHVTRAAARIGITQSAMSHALSRLRALLDDPLFVRTARGMVPTPRAQELAAPLADALGRMESLLSHRSSFDAKTAQRTFRIGAGDYGELAFLAPLTARLQRDAPGIDLVVEAVPADPPVALESGRLDVIVGFSALDWPGVYRKQLFVDRFVCVVRKDHPAVKRTLSLETYVKLPHVLVSPQGSGRAYLDEVLRERGLARRVAVRVPHFLVAPLVIAGTDLVLTIPERVARVFEPALGLKIVPCPIPLDALRMNQIWHERSNRDPAHAWLRDTLAEVVDAADFALPTKKSARP